MKIIISKNKDIILTIVNPIMVNIEKMEDGNYSLGMGNISIGQYGTIDEAKSKLYAIYKWLQTEDVSFEV